MTQVSKIKVMFSEFIEDYPFHFLLLLLLLLLEGLSAAATVLSVVPIADYLIDPTFSNPSKITSFILNSILSFDITVNFWIVGFIFVGFNIINGILKVAVRYAILRIKYVVLKGLLSDSLVKFFRARWEFFSSSSQGQLLNTLNKELPIIGDTLGHIATQASQIIQFFIYISVPIWLNPSMTIIALALAAVFAIPFLYLNKYSYSLGVKSTSTANIAMGVLSEILQNARIILGFGLQKKSRSRYIEAFDAHIDVTLKSQVLTTAVPISYAPLGMLSTVIALGLTVQQGVQVSELAAVMWSLLSALPILSALLQTHVSVSNFIPSYEQLQFIRNRANNLREVLGEKVFERIERGIDLRDVSFSYPSRNNTINKLNMHIKKGSMTALIGKSGSGKSTVTDLFLGLQVPDSGAILIDDIPLDKWNQNSFREKIGYVPQETVLFHASIRENLLWVNDLASEAELWNVLKLANSDQFIKELPDGIDTMVGDRGVRLSGGQRQRIALARALLRKPELLILDEATSSLDLVSEKAIQRSIDRLPHSVTILVIAHRLSTIVKADYIYVMDSGTIVEQGSYNHLKDLEKGVFSKMLEKQTM